MLSPSRRVGEVRSPQAVADELREKCDCGLVSEEEFGVFLRETIAQSVTDPETFNAVFSTCLELLHATKLADKLGSETISSLVAHSGALLNTHLPTHVEAILRAGNHDCTARRLDRHNHSQCPRMFFCVYAL
jgi:hypothetical protein